MISGFDYIGFYSFHRKKNDIFITAINKKKHKDYIL
jgi:hypothetical protein